MVQNGSYGAPFKHPSTGFYYFRRAIPTDLLPHFSGKREFKKSLQTKCVTEAKSRFAKQAADFEQLCENIRLQIRDAGVRDVTSSAAHFINRREEQYRQAADLPRELHAARALAKLMPRTQGDSPDAAPAAHKVAHRQRATWVEEFAQRLHLFGDIIFRIPKLRQWVVA